MYQNTKTQEQVKVLSSPLLEEKFHGSCKEKAIRNTVMNKGLTKEKIL
jgi:hypothetical protein